ncbi:MAG TPA: PQQ-binding-like beta-propeller repeat protein [Methylomirabilota bacterium]|nr:PQQ-binding-like beta-propeller repeat protein [Methylomirabilota bacterium]
MRTLRSLPLLVLVGLLTARAHASSIETAFPTFDPGSSLNASAASGDTLFLAGHARWAGPLTGGGVPLDGLTMTAPTGFPHVNGHVLAATPDGSGGWYIGGTFTHVGGRPHVNLAHVNANLSVDNWAPSSNNDVITLLATPTEVYFSGTFTAVNGQPSTGFAAVARTTGATTFNPPMGGLVAALATDGNRLFAGGDFASASNQPRTRLAAYRLADHALTGWTAPANALVAALRFANGVVYVAGNFNTVMGLPRGGAAALDPVTAEPTAWDPHMGSFATYGVRALIPVGDRVYLGGGFTQMGGLSRLGLAAVDTASGALTTWDPQVRNTSPGSSGATVTSLELSGSRVVAGGTFEAVGAVACSNLAWLDATTGVPLPGSPEAPGEARALASSGSRLYVGGRFSTLGASRRGDLLALRISTGELLPWAPDATRDRAEVIFGNVLVHTSSLTSIAVDAERVYVGQSFFEGAAGSDVGEVVAYSRETGAKLWERPMYRTVSALAVRDTVLYVGGEFFSPSRAVVAVSAATGAEIPWGVDADARAYALQATSAGLVVGGVFTSLGGQPRSHLAMLDYATGEATAWDPEPDAAVWSLAAAGKTLFCGGDFTSIAGRPRTRLAALALDTGEPDGWAPAANATVRALDYEQGVLYVGGGFTTVAGQPRTGLAALNPSSGAVLPLEAGLGLGHAVASIVAAAGHTFASGSQTSAGTEPTQALTVVAGPGSLPDSDRPGGRAGRATLRIEPQPARTVASVKLRLPRETDAEIGLYDLNGRRLAILEPWGHRPAGEVTVALEARKLPPGIYLVRAITPEGDIAGKLVILP